VTAYSIDLDGPDRIDIEDPDLTLQLIPHWAVFADSTGPALAIPADRIQRITREDTPQETPTWQQDEKPPPAT
jgi:hypothetical protein